MPSSLETSNLLAEYQAFLQSKVTIASEAGFTPTSEPHESLKPHQVDSCNWAIAKGRAAIFASFGLGKSRMQLQLMKWVHEHTGGKVLIVAPLGVRQEFTRNDGPAMGMEIEYCRNDAEVANSATPYVITNYERVRDGQINIAQFAGATLDEASVLRSYGSKTTQQFLNIFQSVQYRFVCTATPSPNRYKELIHYAHFLGVMDTGLALTKFFGRNSKRAGDLKLYPHMENEFWLWVASWALFINRPSDLGYSDEGYDLPKLNIHWHRIDVDYSREWKRVDNHGQAMLFPHAKQGLGADAQERKHTLNDRIQKTIEIIQDDNPSKHWLIWHDLESERHLLEKQLPEAKTVYGSQELEEREELILGFSHGDYRILATKPTIAGSGCNFQRHCSDAIFVSPSFKFNDVIQAVHRIYRFLQTQEVNIHFVFAETQSDAVTTLKRKWAEHDLLVQKMTDIVKRYGLSHEALKMVLTRNIGVDRSVVQGNNFTCVHNDCVIEAALMADDSVDCIITSIPFGDHYEYSASYNDFGFNQGDEPFFEQMDFLCPSLYRVLKPGRMACIHTKDRIVYGSVSGLGMYSVNEFSDKTVQAFKKAGFIYCGRITIDTDVVRENAQTYRLGWSENAKDSTKMGCGSNEYVLIFRKWHPSMSPEGNANGPLPVTKDNAEYSRSRWQIQASGIWKSSGDRLLDPDFLKSMDGSELYRWWKERCKSPVIYNYDDHIAASEAVESAGNLPAAFMMFAPHSKNPDVWTDINRMRTLNTEQSRKVEENHICPLQLDVIKRLIDRFSNPGDLVYDPFGGIGSVPYQAMKMDRKAYMSELNLSYFKFAVGYCEQVDEVKVEVPTLFDLAQFCGAGG